MPVAPIFHHSFTVDEQVLEYKLALFCFAVSFRVDEVLIDIIVLEAKLHCNYILFQIGGELVSYCSTLCQLWSGFLPCP